MMAIKPAKPKVTTIDVAEFLLNDGRSYSVVELIKKFGLHRVEMSVFVENICKGEKYQVETCKKQGAKHIKVVSIDGYEHTNESSNVTFMRLINAM